MVETYKPLYTIKEAAMVLKVNVSKVYDLTNSKRLPYIKLGQRKIRGVDLERFIMTFPDADPENEEGSTE